MCLTVSLRHFHRRESFAAAVPVTVTSARKASAYCRSVLHFSVRREMYSNVCLPCLQGGQAVRCRVRRIFSAEVWDGLTVFDSGGEAALAEDNAAADPVGAAVD